MSRTWRSGTPRPCCANTGRPDAPSPLLAAGLDPLESLVSHTATGKGMRAGLASRGWRRTDWEAGSERAAGARRWRGEKSWR